MYSEWLAANQKVGWFRNGSNIVYYRNNITYVLLNCLDVVSDVTRKWT